MRKIAFIQSCWHKDIVDQFKFSFTETIKELLQNQVEIDYFDAPGVVEIPLLAKLSAKKQCFDAIVVCGLIVDHGVYRHEFVAQAVMDSTMGVQMEMEVPVIYGILTAQDFLSEGREAFYREHFLVKGKEAANACSKTLSNIMLLTA
ncbi:MAG TPA: 6,7-dimethyl-8-ribityllumazine synthase [Gammaproteobacteria bacterium]|nr:6,7-dimethyl-8-ribityllumazine synthase [Gammaproteobacteria bacterium]HIL98700.1 6,7-dimethyl-8-ribityllumazine synthase [Pseudomonadales bacterium]